MARLSTRARLLCAAGVVVLMTAIPVAHPASAQGINDIVRNLNNTMNPNDAQRREDQARRDHQVRHREGRSEDGQYRHGDRPTSESREYNRNGGDRGYYDDRGNNGQRW
jgi:hypothetical protein